MTSVFTRGLRSEHTQVLLDGIPINQGLQGAFNFADLTIDDIDVASKQAHLDLPGEIALKRERRLLPTRDYPPSENMATAADDVRA